MSMRLTFKEKKKQKKKQKKTYTNMTAKLRGNSSGKKGLKERNLGEKKREGLKYWARMKIVLLWHFFTTDATISVKLYMARKDCTFW